MTRWMRSLMIACAVTLVAALAWAAVPDNESEGRPENVAAAQTLQIRIQPWHLLQHDGAQLYGELCASCHGVTGAGSPGMAAVHGFMAPPLTGLERAGIPRRHWAYVIRSGCDDHHHWTPGGDAAMPCWQRIFRQSLGNDAASLMVSAKLIDYLETIQQ